jgi:hypothetical protein
MRRPAAVKASNGANYDRLDRLKFKYDPDNFFPFNQDIAPHAQVRASWDNPTEARKEWNRGSDLNGRMRALSRTAGSALPCAAINSFIILSAPAQSPETGFAPPRNPRASTLWGLAESTFRYGAMASW